METKFNLTNNQVAEDYTLFGVQVCVEHQTYFWAGGCFRPVNSSEILGAEVRHISCRDFESLGSYIDSAAEWLRQNQKLGDYVLSVVQFELDEDTDENIEESKAVYNIELTPVKLHVSAIREGD